MKADKKKKNLRLCEAVVADDLGGVRAALADGADINARVRIERFYKFGPLAYPPLAALAWAGSVPMAELLLDAGAKIDATDEHGCTALYRAVLSSRSGRMPLIELLLRRGANPTPALVVARGGGAELVQRLLDAGAKVTPAALDSVSHSPELRALLEQWPIRSATASDGDKQLMLAARAGALDTVTALLGQGASAVTRDADGSTAIDHALQTGHSEVALVLERAAASGHAQEELLLATLRDSAFRISLVAARSDLEARSAGGLTPLMLAARYRRHAAMRELVASGAKLTPGALVVAIAAGNLEGLRLLFDLGATIAAEQATLLQVACQQPDSDLLKELLLRGLDTAQSQDLVCASTESARLVRNARAGRLPPARPTAASWQDCPLCRDLGTVTGWHCRTYESVGQLPAVTEQFETFGFEHNGLWKCPHCCTYYEYTREHDNAMIDGYDCEYLTRLSNAKALESLRAMPARRPQLERELAALELRVKFDEAAAVPAAGKVQIPGSEVKDGKRLLMIYSLGSDGAKQLAYRNLPEAEHDALVATLKARGFPVAETDFFCDFVWVCRADGVDVYDRKGKVFDATGEQATLEDGRVFARADLARVIAFAEEDYIYRGIKAALQSGKEVALVTEAAGSAMGDFTYTRNELLWETGWCTTLGVAIARWAGIPFVNLI
ncbi:MAG: ankyrin repeat domain-containing protein [Deltaproteobacteria bacterium]|nr:ankyrin repeat domain-containing protein [Deltaproteobacteria bacterium]